MYRNQGNRVEFLGCTSRDIPVCPVPTRIFEHLVSALLHFLNSFLFLFRYFSLRMAADKKKAEKEALKAQEKIVNGFRELREQQQEILGELSTLESDMRELWWV